MPPKGVGFPDPLSGTLNAPLRRALGLQPDDPGPHEAIDAFVKLYNPYISVLAVDGNQVVFRKKRSAE
jgi:hypothetical protein